MTRLRPILKVVVLASSLLLMGAFVALRAGAFDSWLKSESETGGTTFSSSKSTFILVPRPDQPAILPPETPAPGSITPATPNTTIMGGSKFIVLTPPANTPTPASSDFTIIGGSKSGILISPSQLQGLPQLSATQTQQQQPPAAQKPSANPPKP